MAKPQEQDEDINKGAVENGVPGNDPTNVNLSGQLGHRSSATQPGGMAEGMDSDLPEPGQREEHSGEKGSGE